MQLTDLFIRKLAIPSKGQRVFWDKGLGVKVSPGGTKSFVVKHKNRVQTLGQYPSMSLKQARDAALAVKLIDRPQARLEGLSDARTAYLKECKAKNRPATVRQYSHFLTQVSKTNLSDVIKSDINLSSPHAVVIWKVFFNWCIRNELVDKNPFAHASAQWNTRDRVLTDDELKAVWAYSFPPYSNHLKLLLLSGQRLNQFAKFQHDWIHADTIRFPADIMKNRKAHTLPITPLVSEILEQLQPFNGWSRAKSRIDKFVTIPHWTTHDLRRTFSTIHARLGTPIHVTEAILSHTSGAISGVAAVYNRHTYLDESRSALLNYEAFIKENITCSGTSQRNDPIG